MRRTWLLEENKYEPSPKSSPDRIASTPAENLKKGGWNHRHHVTVSGSNGSLHDNQREYFSRSVLPRSKRVLPQRPTGITAHTYPHAHRGNPNGQDDSPSLTGHFLNDGDELPLPVLPHGLLPRLLQTFQVAPHHPDTNFAS